MKKMPKKSNSSATEEYNIKELSLEDLAPNIENMKKEKQGGVKLLVIASPGGGKSTLIKSLMYFKQDIIPYAQIHSGTESENNFYKSFCPEITIYDSLKLSGIEDFVRRQKIARKFLDNPWGFLVLDDVFENPAEFNKPVFHNLLKNGRHYKMDLIVGMQYCMDMKPAIRSSFDGIFILREGVPTNREKLYKNYGSCIPTLELFNELMDKLTEDHMAMYIQKTGTESNKLEDVVKFYKAPLVDESWKFGCKYFWEYHKERFDETYASKL